MAKRKDLEEIADDQTKVRDEPLFTSHHTAELFSRKSVVHDLDLDFVFVFVLVLVQLLTHPALPPSEHASLSVITSFPFPCHHSSKPRASASTSEPTQ